MWRALKAEFTYFLPWLLGGLGIAAFVSGLLIVLTVFVNDSDGVPGFVVGMFPIIAGMVGTPSKSQGTPMVPRM